MTHKYPHVARFVVAVNVPANVDPMDVRASLEALLRGTDQPITPCNPTTGLHRIRDIVMYVKRLTDK